VVRFRENLKASIGVDSSFNRVKTVHVVVVEERGRGGGGQWTLGREGWGAHTCAGTLLLLQSPNPRQPY
jgi:hypothetical protein